MQRKRLALLTTLMLLVACTGKMQHNSTVKGTFSVRNAPDSVQVTRYELQGATLTYLTESIPVLDGTFEVCIPTCTLEFSRVDNVSFISDGSCITIDMDSGTVTSSDNNGIQSRYTAYVKARENILTDIMEKARSLSGDEQDNADHNAESLNQELHDRWRALDKEVLFGNRDNVIAAVALQNIEALSTIEEMRTYLDTLPTEMKLNYSVNIKATNLDAKFKTRPGVMFTDFEIVQDEEHPESSTVRLSDFVGKGKYVLADFWASWCGPCRSDIKTILRPLYDDYHAKGVDFLSIAVWDKPEDSIMAAGELGITWNQIVNAQRTPTDIYGMTAIPEMILFGPDGTIVSRDFAMIMLHLDELIGQ